METVGEINDFLINAKLVNQNIFLFIFRFHQKLVPFFSGEQKSRVTYHFRALLGQVLYNVSAVILPDQNLIKIGKKLFIFLLVFFRRKIFPCLLYTSDAADDQ